VDMGAPVFVKAGTLFQDDQHQPDMPVDQGQYQPRSYHYIIVSKGLSS
jgi:hypothetical protein